MVGAFYKGASVVSLRQALRARGLERSIADGLEAPVREHFERALATDWMAVDEVATIYAAAAPALHPDRALPVRALGRDLARTHLTGIYRVLLRLATAEMIVGQTARLWSTYNGKGQLRVVRSGPGAARLVLEDYPEYPAVVRESLCGYIVGAVELTGASNVRVVSEAGAGGAWTFDVTWR